MEALSIKEIIDAVGGRLISGQPDTLIDSVSTNSKEIGEGGLFVPIKGERVDAHDYLDSAFDNGAAAAIVSRDMEPADDRILIRTENTSQALLDLAAYYRNKFRIPVIGVTGSVGKTTTKEMIAAALGTKLCVLKTAGNMNSQVGVPLTLFRIESEHEAAVVEMGISEIGEMSKLAAAVKPDIAVISNIGVSHIANMGNQSNIRKEKLCIINEFENGGTLFINGNDSMLMEVLLAGEELRTTSGAEIDLYENTKNALLCSSAQAFGTDENCTYRAVNIRTKEGRTLFAFDYIHPLSGLHGREEIELAVLGLHNVQNALVALAAAMKLGIDPDISKQGLKEYLPIAMRGQIHKINGIQLIDDSYNASPDSMKSGISVLLSLEGARRRLAVLADVLELGEYSYECHYGVGVYIAERAVHEVITIGREAAAIALAVRTLNPSIQVNSFHNNEEAIQYLRNHLTVGDAVLVKGSRGMHTEEIVKAVMETKN